MGKNVQSLIKIIKKKFRSINNNFEDFTVLEIRNTRTFQHLALLIDRSDFREDIKKIRSAVLSKYYSDTKSLLNQDITDTPKEIINLLEKYRYPLDLTNAILAIIIRNKITNKEVSQYKPQIGQPKNKLRNYIPHPIDIRLDKKIKDHRQWYLLYKQNNNETKNVYLGYREVSKIIGKPYTTIATAINSYQKKIEITITKESIVRTYY